MAISTVVLMFTLMVVGSDRLAEGVSAIPQLASVVMGFVYLLELIVWFYAVRHIDVSLASSITTPWPALTMVLAVALLGDRVEIHQIIALAAVVACIYGLTLASLRKARDAKAAYTARSEE
ncbi:MAG: EamA family transporter [Pseudomonadota bacterium]